MVISIAIFLSRLGIFGYIIDIVNWFYIKERLKLLRSEPTIWDYYKLRISSLGVLYLIIEIDKALPTAYVDQHIDTKLGMLNEALLTVNLSGLLDYESRRVGNDDSEDNKTDLKKFYLIKYIPVFRFFNFWYTVKSVIVGYISYKLAAHFEITDVIAGYFNKIVEFLAI